MCSNTCNSACVCEIGDNVSSIWRSALKKQTKRPRVPKRGPGVAELEKILREQETMDLTDNNKGNSEGFSSFVSHHSNSNSYPSSSMKFHPPQPPTSPKKTVPSSPMSSNLPTNVPSAPVFDHLGPTTLPTIASIYGNCGSLDKNGGSVLVSSEKELFPLNLNSCKSKLNMNEPIDINRCDSANSPSRNVSNEFNLIWPPYSATIPKRNNQYSHSSFTANQFRGTANSSVSLSIGLHNHPELPSNQSNSCYNNIYRVPKEHKMVGMKRSHSSDLENSLIPSSNFHVLPSFSHYNRLHQLSVNDSHDASSFNSTKECYKYAKRGSALELSNTRFNSDMAAPRHANLPPFVTPGVPSPPMHLFPGILSKQNVLPSQVNEEEMDSHKHSESSESNHKPFYNFLEVEDSEVSETMLGANCGGCEAGRVGIDLNLKL